MSFDHFRRSYPDDDLMFKGAFGLPRVIENYLGAPLHLSLPKANIRRVLEVGVGWSFTNMKQFARQVNGTTPVFEPNDLLAVDRSLWADNQLKTKLGSYSDRFRREEVSVEELSHRIKVGQTEPFDLVLSKGLVSVGWPVIKWGKESEAIERAKRVISAMKDCMNLSNPDALLITESQVPDEILLVSRPLLTELGLEIVDSEKSSSRDWTERFQGLGLFPQTHEDAGFELVLCKPISH